MKPYATIYTKEQGKIAFATSDEWIAFDDSSITYHREDGPAKEWANGTKFYYRNDELHREDGSAIEWADGTKEYWLNGKRHREDGPAVVWTDGDKEYWLNDKLHREDGPAKEWADGTKEYWLNGKRLSEEEFNKIIRNKSILRIFKRFVHMTADTLIYLANKLKHLI